MHMHVYTEDRAVNCLFEYHTRSCGSLEDWGQRRSDVAMSSSGRIEGPMYGQKAGLPKVT